MSIRRPHRNPVPQLRAVHSMPFLRECEQLCQRWTGRTLAGWKVREMSVQPAPDSEGFARLQVHVEPADGASGRPAHWSTTLIPLDRLYERLQHPDTLLTELFPPERREEDAARNDVA